MRKNYCESAREQLLVEVRNVVFYAPGEVDDYRRDLVRIADEMPARRAEALARGAWTGL